jgi:pimeloyl-ACP methyl ester carboxylesterase
MPTTEANGITIYYETAGDPSGPPLLLVMGLGGQLTAWDEGFVEALVGEGFFVVRFDNRDVGLSSWLDEAGVPDVMAAFEGRARAPYLLSDMAADAAALLDALGVGRAHVFGISMGGMIAQQLAIDHPGKVSTLVSVMSTTGDPAVGQPHPEALQVLLRPVPPSREAAVEQAVEGWRVIGSPGFAFDEQYVRERAAADYDRAFHPAGVARQAVAIVASPDRTPGLRRLSLPALVIHGEADRLVDPSGGKATAAAIPGARLHLVPGMGHDLPRQLHEDFAARVAALAGLRASP